MLVSTYLHFPPSQGATPKCSKSDHVCKQTLPQVDHAWYHGGVVRVASGHQPIHGYTLIRTQKIESYNIEFDYNW